MTAPYRLGYTREQLTDLAARDEPVYRLPKPVVPYPCPPER
jgi:hypothetical protein